MTSSDSPRPDVRFRSVSSVISSALGMVGAQGAIGSLRSISPASTSSHAAISTTVRVRNAMRKVPSASTGVPSVSAPVVKTY